jgi:hypothetical protein
MFGPAFSQFNPGRRGGGMAPSPIILATAGVRIAEIDFTHANIIAGTAQTIVAGLPGFILMPLSLTSEKDISVAYAPTNASFTLRFAGVSTALMSALTPVITSTGTRIDRSSVSAASFTTISQAVGNALVIIPNAGNGAGSVANKLRFTLAYQMVRALA